MKSINTLKSNTAAITAVTKHEEIVDSTEAEITEHEAREESGGERSLVGGVGVGQEVKQKTIRGHGPDNSGEGDYTTKHTEDKQMFGKEIEKP